MTACVIEMENINVETSNNDEIPLPEGKQYHLFISYRDVKSDRTWVHTLISCLENEHKLKCCDHLNEFVPGRSIVDNISHFVPKCMKTIIVLSKEYHNSYWCKYEMEYTLCMSMDKRQHIIPIVIEDCEIPDHLKPMTYLDCRGEAKSYLPRLISAIKCDEGADQFNAIDAFALEPKYKNLDLVYTEESIQHICPCYCTFEGKYIPQELNQKGVSMNLEEYNKVRRIIATVLTKETNGTTAIVLLCLLGFSLVFFFTGLILLLNGLSFINVYSDLERSTKFHVRRNLGIFFLACLPVLIVGIFLLCRRVINKGNSSLSLVFKRARGVFKEYNLMCCCWLRLNKVYINYYYYDWKPCMLFVKEHIRNNSSDQRNDRINTITQFGNQMNHELTDQQLEERSSKILLKLSESYICKFAINRLDEGRKKRHCERAICLCEFAELQGVI